MSKVSAERVQVRVWADAGPGRAPEQRVGVLSRAAAADGRLLFGGRHAVDGGRPWGSYAGWPRWDCWTSVGYLSCVSGSSWAVVPYLYAADGSERLGSVTGPEHLTRVGLERLRFQITARACDPSFPCHPRDAGGGRRCPSRRGLDPCDWRDLSGAFWVVRPRGPGRVRAGVWVGGARCRGRCSVRPSRCHRPRAARPFPVVHTRR